MGSFMRYSGDDYCYAAVLIQNGFPKAQWDSYFSISTYNGNRFSLTLLSNLGDLPGPKASGAWPVLTALLWILGAYAVIRVLARRRGSLVTRWEAALLAEALVVFTLSQAPDVYQSLYWRTAMLTYLAPIVLNTLLVSAVAHLARESADPPSRPLPWGLVLIALLSVLAGGFSEAAALWQLVFWATVLAAALAGRLLGKQRPGGLIAPASVMVGGTALALILLAASPTNALRRASFPTPSGVLDVAARSLHDAYLFLHGTAKHDALPVLAFFLFALCISFGWSGGRTERQRPHFGRFAIDLTVIGALAAILITCVMTPSEYVLSSFPADRALIIAHWTVTLALMLAGFRTGTLLSDWLAPNTTRIIQTCAPVIVLALTCFFSAAMVPRILEERAKFERWASLWDTRDEAIRAAQRAGLPDVHVMQLDHLIPDVGELSPDSGFWYNNCAESYYDIDTIIADLPGWDT